MDAYLGQFDLISPQFNFSQFSKTNPLTLNDTVLWRLRAMFGQDLLEEALELINNGNQVTIVKADVSGRVIWQVIDK